MLIINPEYSENVPSLSISEYNSLKDSIKSYGQHLPIIVNKDLVILDGHHRFKICQDLNLTPNYEIKEFPTEAHEQLFVIDSNLQRRSLTPYIRANLALKSKPILEEIAKSNSKANLKQNENGPSGKYLPVGNGNGRVNEQLGERARLSRDTIRKVEFIELYATEEVKQKLREARTTISKEHSKIQKLQKKQLLINEAAKIELSNNNNCQLHNQDFRSLGSNSSNSISNDSIDLIFTDPPYARDSLELYRDLGIFASRVLKEGGSLVTFVGQYDMLKIGNLVVNSGLRYLWPICVEHTGHYAKIWGFGIQISVAWKPLLWFIKGDKAGNSGYIVDYIESAPPDKEAHEWQQSTVEAEHIIKALTVENQIVLNPFMGSGTTRIAALNHNRKFIGIEIDKQRFEIATANIHNCTAK